MKDASPLHAHIQTLLAHELVGPYYHGLDGPGGWWFLLQPKIRFTERDKVAPDLAGWQRERLARLPDEFPIGTVPDWICEILSPRTARRDRTKRIDLYARTGVENLWVIDPTLGTVEVYRNHDGRWLLLGTFTEDDTMALEPFLAQDLEVGRLFLAPSDETPEDVAVG